MPAVVKNAPPPRDASGLENRPADMMHSFEMILRCTLVQFIHVHSRNGRVLRDRGHL